MAEQVLQLFVSSPGDVANERRRIEAVIERLNGEFSGRVRIKAIRWETSYYSAHETFQNQIPEAKDCDLVIGIFGTRLGTELPQNFQKQQSGEPYQSGTAYETLSAIEARKSGKKTPDIYVFRCPDRPLIAIGDPNEPDIKNQWARLNKFFETYFHNTDGQFLAAYQEFASTDDFAVKTEDCLRQWLAQRGFVTKDATWDLQLRGSPFPGLAAFDEERLGLFFGRDLVTTHAIERLKETAARGNPFLLLIGASGSGKSSLLRAALLPRLVVPGTIPAIDLWRTVYVVPGQNPLLSLAEALFEESALGAELREGEFPTKEVLAELFSGDAEAAMVPIHAAMMRAAKARAATYDFGETRPCRLAVGIDQAERLTLEIDPTLSSIFTKLIEALVTHELAFVIVALRSDAYARFQLMPGFRNLNAKGASVDLLPPVSEELEEAITKPAAACRPPLIFETRNDRSLAEVLVADANCGSPLPLLQIALARLFDAQAKRQDGVLRFIDYPGLAASVTQTAEDLLLTLDKEAQAEVPALIAALAHDVAADPVTGNLSPVVTSVRRNVFERGRVSRRNLIDAFVNGRLLSIEGDEDDVRIRPTHDALLGIWPEAVKILHDYAPLIRVRHILEPIVREWSGASTDDKPDYTDLSPALMGGAQRLLEILGDDLPKPMRDFIGEALAVQEGRRNQAIAESAVKEQVKAGEALAKANKRVIRLASGGLVVTSTLLALLYSAETRLKDQENKLVNGLSIVTKDTNEVISKTARTFRSAAGIPIRLIKDILDPIRDLQDQLLNLGAVSPELRAGKAATLDETAITFFKLGDSDRALESAQQSRDILTDLLKLKPDEVIWQERMLSDNVMIGDALKMQGELEQALRAYHDSFAAAGILAGKQLESSRWKHWLTLCGNKTGDVLVEQGNFNAAKKIYQQGLTDALAEADGVVKQRDIAWSYARLGKSFFNEGSLTDALEDMQRSIDILQTLTKADAKNAVLSQELSSSYNGIGDILIARDDVEAADKAYQMALSIARTLANEDKANAEWQHALSTSHEKTGDVNLKRNKVVEAVAEYKNSIEIRKDLVETDPKNLDWKTDFVKVQWKLASAGDEVATRLRSVVETLTQIKADGKLPFEMIRLLPVAEDKVAKLSGN
jgi:tetratricopeptide (TPR) repeat protein